MGKKFVFEKTNGLTLVHWLFSFGDCMLLLMNKGGL
jgi:hypothetical protein